MLHCVSTREPAARPKKESKRRYLNLKSNENLTSDESAFAHIRPDFLDFQDFFRYPVHDAAYEALRDHLGVRHVLLTGGSHDAIRVIACTLDRDRNRVLLTLPNYDGYRHYFAVNGISTVGRHRVPARRHDLSALTDEAVAEGCNIVVLTNPDPFVGDSFDRDEIEAFVTACGAHGISVVLDEVYAGFGRESDVGLTEAHDNLLVINSLSKSYGMPGLRVGWVAGASETIDRLGCEYSESTISGFCLSVLIRVLGAEGWVRDYRAAVVRNREALAEELARLDSIVLYPGSATNFLLFRTAGPDRPDGLWADLLRRGIYLGDLNGIPGYEGHYRVTACPEAERERLVDGLEHLRRQEDPGRRPAVQRQDDARHQALPADGNPAS